MTEENITIFPNFCNGTPIAHFVKEKNSTCKSEIWTHSKHQSYWVGKESNQMREKETFCEGQLRLTIPYCLYLCMCVQTAVLKFTYTLQNFSSVFYY